MDYYNQEMMLNQNDLIVFKTTTDNYIENTEAIVLNVTPQEVRVHIEHLSWIKIIPRNHHNFTVYPCEHSLHKLLNHFVQQGNKFKATKIWESIWENQLWELKRDYESLERLDTKGPPPLPDFHDNVGWQEANFEGYIDVMYDELDIVRTKLHELYRITINTPVHGKVKHFLLRLQKNNSKNWCSIEITHQQLQNLQFLNLAV